MKSKKGFQLSEVPQLVIVLFIIAIVLGVGATVLSNLALSNNGLSYRNVYAQNTTDYAPYGYVAWYRMDVNSTTTLKDETNTYNGTITNATYTTSGKVNGAYRFDYSQDYITIVPNNHLNKTNYLTVVAWVKMSDKTTIKPIFSHAITNTNYRWMCYIHSSDYLFCGIGNGTTTNQTSGSKYMPLNNWAMVTLMINNTYFDVYQNITKVITHRTIPNGIGDYNADIQIGKLGSYATEFNGTIDEVRIYNRSLSDAEISYLYNASASKYNTTYLESIQPVYSNTYNITNNGAQGMTDFSEWQSTFVVIIAAVVILGIIYKYLFIS